MGTTGFVAQAFGRQNASEIKSVFMQALRMALFVAVLLWLLAWPMEEFAFYLLQAEAAVEEQGRLYFWARIAGAPFVLFNYVVIGTLMGMQKPKLTLLLISRNSEVSSTYLKEMPKKPQVKLSNKR